MKGKILGLLAVGLLAVASGPASATIIYTATTDNPVSVISGLFANFHFVPTGTPPVLTADFGADKTLQITYSAPPGMRFQITPPPGLSTRLVAALSTTQDIFNPIGFADAGSFSFSGAVGTTPTVSFIDLFTVGASPDEMRTLLSWSLSEPFEFESITMIFDVPTSFTTSFDGFVPAEVRLTGGARFSGTPPPSRFFNLVPIRAVPEPGTLALLGLGLLGLGVVRRRAA